MSALAGIRGGLIGVAAVVVPSAALVFAEFCIIRGVETFLEMLCVTYFLVTVLAWTCVRVAQFRPKVALLLTTLPFGLLLLLTLTALFRGEGAGFLICLGELAVAVLVAWGGARLARR